MRAAFAMSLLLLAGCGEYATPEPDQCLRAELFKSCMASLPAGPQATKYNDWDEVVSACGSQAYYQSLRRPANIAKECKP